MIRIVSFFVVVSCSFLLFFSTGCGGKSSPAPAPAPAPEVNNNTSDVSSDEVNDNELEPKKEPKKKKKKKKVVKEDTADEDMLPPELQKPEIMLPVASSQWTEDEFVYIRSAQPTMFDMAIAELSKRLADSERADYAATILNQFVQSVIPDALALEEVLSVKGKQLEEAQKEEEEKERERNKKKTSQTIQTSDIEFYQLTQNQVRACMNALASSSSETAGKAIAAFLAGGIMTDDNKVALEAIMFSYAQKSLDGKLSAEEEEILLSFLLMPENAVAMAAEYAGIEVPKPQIVEMDANGNVIQNKQQSRSVRGSHSPILVTPTKKVVFKILGGNGNMTEFTPLDVQASVLKNFCPASSPLFRARLARTLLGKEILEVANSQEKQQFLLHDVLDGFLMKPEFENVIAHVLIYKQPDVDDTLRSKLEANLLLSHQALLKTHFSFIDPKTLDAYRTATTLKRDQLMAERLAEQEAERSAMETSTEQVSVSLLSRKAATDAKSSQNQNTLRNPNQNRNTKSDPIVTLLTNPKNQEMLAKEIWTPEIRDMLWDTISTELDKLVDAGMSKLPEPGSKVRVTLPTMDKRVIQALQMYLLTPCVETRYNIYKVLDQAWIIGPEAFRMALFDKMEMEPGFLMVMKSMDRRIAPKSRDARKTNIAKKNVRGKTNTKQKEVSPAVLMREKRMEVGVAWMNMCYTSVSQWCKYFSEAATVKNELQKTARLLDKNIPKVAEPTLPEELRKEFPLPSGSKLLSYYTATDPAMPPMSESGGLKVTFFEFECHAMLPRMISAFKSKVPKLLERGILDKPTGQNMIQNGYWLERFELNQETGHRESVDILIVPKGMELQQKNNNNRDVTLKKTAMDYRIYVLMMEMDDITGDHQSKLTADDEDENVEFADEEDEGESVYEDESEYESEDEE